MSASPQTLKNEADTIQLQDGAKIKTTNIYSVRHGYPITPQEALDVGQVITHLEEAA